MFNQQTFLITGIADKQSLAMYIAKEIIRNNGKVICAGLGVTHYHDGISDKAKDFLNTNFNDFAQSVKKELGPDTPIYTLDVTQPNSIIDFVNDLKTQNITLNGWLHAIAMDKTIRHKKVKNLLDVTFQEFCDTMEVSAYSLISVTHHLLHSGILQSGSAIASLSYIAAGQVTFHPYKNISIAKAALERITVELAHELGKSHGIRVNCVRFSPYMGSKAGTATLNQEDYNTSNEISPLGNASPEDLAFEVAHLLRPNCKITGEIRHVDGGYHIVG